MDDRQSYADRSKDTHQRGCPGECRALPGVPRNDDLLNPADELHSSVAECALPDILPENGRLRDFRIGNREEVGEKS